jgi:hypothetical protein
MGSLPKRSVNNRRNLRRIESLVQMSTILADSALADFHTGPNPLLRTIVKARGNTYVEIDSASRNSDWRFDVFRGAVLFKGRFGATTGPRKLRRSQLYRLKGTAMAGGFQFFGWQSRNNCDPCQRNVRPAPLLRTIVGTRQASPLPFPMGKNRSREESRSAPSLRAGFRGW